MKNKIKFLRRSEDFDLTQDELATALKVSRQTIVAIENGREPSGSLMLKIGKFFNKDPREIFFTEDGACSVQVGEVDSA
ncbi:helix-turn-helix transcriptional regulator [Niallia taxi]|uniref:Transcriptional regulator n=1 Tax=Niallia taxi TaxID=2499688 RepID=A0A3S2TX12_9BACI|nr:helix-turn-helix transcriptional regulator [Niallia taxi]RVT67688.1 transcriptional regulator [Niallia taxi]